MSHTLTRTFNGKDRVFEEMVDLSVESNDLFKVYDEGGSHLGYVLNGRYIAKEDAEQPYVVTELHYTFTRDPALPYVHRYPVPAALSFLDIVREVEQLTMTLKDEHPECFYREPCDAVWHTTRLDNGVLTFDNDT